MSGFRKFTLVKGKGEIVINLAHIITVIPNGAADKKYECTIITSDKATYPVISSLDEILNVLNG